jgi:hypothetical protein
VHGRGGYKGGRKPFRSVALSGRTKVSICTTEHKG